MANKHKQDDASASEKVIYVEKEAKPKLSARIKARASKSFHGDDGSFIWLMKVCYAWIREIVIAINSMMSNRRAQKRIDLEDALEKDEI